MILPNPTTTFVRLRNSTGRVVLKGEPLGIGKKPLYGKMGRAVEVSEALGDVRVISLDRLEPNKTGTFAVVYP